MGRNNGDFDAAAMSVRNHGPASPLPRNTAFRKTQMQKVMSEGSPESQKKLKETMGKTDARRGGFAGHLLDNRNEPAYVMSYQARKAKERGKMEQGAPIVDKPKKHFRPK